MVNYVKYQVISGFQWSDTPTSILSIIYWKRCDTVYSTASLDNLMLLFQSMLSILEVCWLVNAHDVKWC